MQRLVLLLSLFVLIVLGVVGIWYWTMSSASRPMSLAQALTAAQSSECAQKGTLPGTGTYNPNSQTWWLDFSPRSEFLLAGCNPACVVSASSTAEINWRCTGAIQPASYDDLITVDTPLPNTAVQSPLEISGKARGPWYFEAQFPVTLVDGNGTVLAQAPAHAQGDWMTNDYVPFTAVLTFNAPTTATGTLILKKDNPSGLPQNADQLEVPVSFSAPANSFSEDGTVTRNNPGQRPNVWYLVYERSGAPGLSVGLDLNSVVAPYIDLMQGERVHVEGTLRGSSVTVRSITPISNKTATLIKLYFYDPKLDDGTGGTQCTKNGLVAVDREIPKTTTPLTDAIKLLLRGELSSAERAQGITTEFPLAGVSLTSASIVNGVATLAFADLQRKTSGGSCRVAVLWAQIEATAKQFPTVRSVRFVPEDLFQP